MDATIAVLLIAAGYAAVRIAITSRRLARDDAFRREQAVLDEGDLDEEPLDEGSLDEATRDKLTRMRAPLVPREGVPFGETVPVTVTGIVRVRDALIEAPFSGRLVVFHRSVASPKLGSPVIACGMVPFELETELETVIIDGNHAESTFRALPLDPDPPERVARFLAANQVNAAFAHLYSVEEIAIEPGIRITVSGVACSELDPGDGRERGFRDFTPERTWIRAPLDRSLTLGPAN
jgi:hypothetical protein